MPSSYLQEIFFCFISYSFFLYLLFLFVFCPCLLYVQKSLDPIYTVTYQKEWGKTYWTESSFRSLSVTVSFFCQLQVWKISSIGHCRRVPSKQISGETSRNNRDHKLSSASKWLKSNVLESWSGYYFSSEGAYIMTQIISFKRDKKWKPKIFILDISRHHLLEVF